MAKERKPTNVSLHIYQKKKKTRIIKWKDVTRKQRQLPHIYGVALGHHFDGEREALFSNKKPKFVFLNVYIVSP